MVVEGRESMVESVKEHGRLVTGPPKEIYPRLASEGNEKGSHHLGLDSE